MAAQATPVSDEPRTGQGWDLGTRKVFRNPVSPGLARVLFVMLFVATTGALLGRGWQLAAFPGTMPLLPAGPIKVLGWMGIAAGAALLLSARVRRLRTPVLLSGSVILGLMAVIGWLPHPAALPALFRPIAQIAAPLMLILVARQSWRAVQLLGCWATALCFTAHAFLDLGIPATPPEYLRLCNVLLDLDASGGRTFLAVAAAFDLIAAGLIFWPRTRIPALWALAAWGLLTASARLAAFGYFDFPRVLGEPWVHQTLWRIPHALLPAATALLAGAAASKAVSASVAEPVLKGAASPLSMSRRTSDPGPVAPDLVTQPA